MVWANEGIQGKLWRIPSIFIFIIVPMNKNCLAAFSNGVMANIVKDIVLEIKHQTFQFGLTLLLHRKMIDEILVKLQSTIVKAVYGMIQTS